MKKLGKPPSILSLLPEDGGSFLNWEEQDDWMTLARRVKVWFKYNGKHYALGLVIKRETFLNMPPAVLYAFLRQRLRSLEFQALKTYMDVAAEEPGPPSDSEAAHGKRATYLAEG